MKNCDQGLESIFKAEVTVFTIRTDPKPVNNFFLHTKNCFNFCKHKDKISPKRYRGPWADIGEYCLR